MILQSNTPFRGVALLCATLLTPGGTLLPAQSVPATSAQAASANPGPETTLTAEQLGSLIAPIALNPDPILAQVLAASTYPLEVVEANRWVKQNKALKDEALVQAAAKQDWEPGIQALVMFPSIFQRIDENLTWTTSPGNAFLAQPAQRMRQKAYA
jgi:hypothetical protein